MLISHNWLKSYYTNPEKVPSPKEVAQLFTMHAFEIESMEEKGDDTVYDIKITADRSPYAYGTRFVALELSLLVPELEMLPATLALTKTNIDLSDLGVVVDESLIGANVVDGCSMYSLTKIENVSNGASPEWLKTRLESIGQQSRGAVVDMTNFVMFDTGQPLHAFDADKVDGKICVDRSIEGEKITILGGKEISLPVGTLVIRDSKDILAIAGVKGGVKAEVDAQTKNIYLESANFNQAQVRRTARSLNLLNDSSRRFEQGLTPERFLSGRKTYVYFLTKEQPEVRVGELVVSSDISSIGDEGKLRKIVVDITSASISIHKENIEVPAQLRSFLENILPKTGARVEKQDASTYIVTQPHYRADLTSQADVVDEFLRNKGYEFLTYAEPAKNKVEGLKDVMDKWIAVLRDYFLGLGSDEVKLHTLVDSKENPKATKLANALTSERDSLRADLTTGMTKALEQNIKHLDLVGKKMVQLFEVGKVYVDKGTDVEEKMHLAFGFATVKFPKNKNAEAEMKAIMDGAANELGIPESSITTKYTQSMGIVEIDLEIMIQNSNVEKLNEILKNIPAYKNPETIQYKKASIYPAMSRDIAFFGSNDEDEVAQCIKDQVVKYPIIENYFCFDIFSKEDKTSYAYRFVFQSYEKTLTEEEVSVFMNNIAEEVKTRGWVVR